MARYPVQPILNLVSQCLIEMETCLPILDSSQENNGTSDINPCSSKRSSSRYSPEYQEATYQLASVRESLAVPNPKADTG